MDFCKYRSCEEPSGPYSIKLPLKAREALASRDMTLFLMNRMNWAEDGLRVVIGVMLSGSGRVSDYLRLAYPETFAERQRKTDTDGVRRTLLYRLRYLFRCLVLVADHYTEFRQWSFTGLRMTLDIFCECVRQAVGEKAFARLKTSVDRFSRLWQTVDFTLTDEASVRRELQLMIDDLDEVFEILREAFRAKESAAECEQTAAEKTAEGIAALVASQKESNRLARAGLRRCAELAAAKGTEEADDAYSSLAGLEGLSAAKRRELQACFRYSHEQFPILRGDKSGRRSLGRLAEIVWRDHATEFAALAHLGTDAGYKDARSLAAKLYKLAARYPAANHFRWQH